MAATKGAGSKRNVGKPAGGRKKPIKEVLEDRLKNLRAKLDHPIGSSSMSGDTGDACNAHLNVDSTLSERENILKQIRQVAAGLLALDAGTYGICETCGEPIPKDRMASQPESTMCVDCLTDQEAEEKKRRTRR
jgi:DnaK suppressor protein